MSEKIYVGSGKKHHEYELVNISVCLTDIKTKAEEFIFEYNDKKYIKLIVAKKQDAPDKYGKTHSVRVDTYKPTSAPDQPEDMPNEKTPF